MNDTRPIVSAAIYFEPNDLARVSREWHDRVITWFTTHVQIPQYFWAQGGPFTLGEGQLLNDNHQMLLSSIESGLIETMGISALRNPNADRSDWAACASASTLDGVLFLGLETEHSTESSAFLLAAYSIAKDLFDVRYAISYQMPMSEEPGCYAMGAKSMTFAAFKDRMRLRAAGTPPAKTPNDLWREELIGRRRHLAGLFRGAYPASILSDAHLQLLACSGSPPGSISPLDSGLWLWTLKPHELPVAQEFLESSHALVSQASEQ